VWTRQLRRAPDRRWRGAPHARAILAAVDHAHVAVAGTTRNVRGTVDIIVSESTSTYLLPTALAELRGNWPMTHFSVSVAV
jgi:DNA-binding transcriptional LysR family regulator